MSFLYPPSLPITDSLDQIAALISAHQVVVIAGETGSGKTTQLPKLCLELFHDDGGLIGCTQPRRIAATSVARRVAEELGEYGDLVGSKIRFQDRTSAHTRIKFMTDGVLLAETRSDPLLDRYRVIIVDEAHERNLNIDFLLGYLHTLLNRRDDLKLIITSATIDTEAFARHFGNAPVHEIEGRAFPVEIEYQPMADQDGDASYLDSCADAVADICANRPPGDILVFLPTENDIRSCCETLRGKIPSHLTLPLFGRLQLRDQQRIFQVHGRPKIVVATNVAETSITVPGIRYVVDTGLARIGEYHARSRTMRLPVAKISQAACNQRSGRSGRLGPGVCIRLFDEDDFNSRDPFSTPEIRRSNLAEVILQMISLDLGDPYDFPFLDPPARAAINEGYRTLDELGAITDSKTLTSYGRIMAGLPIDPVISRIIIEANRLDCLTEILVIAAALAIQDPRIRPAEKEAAADAAHRRFAEARSDFLVLLSIWKRYHEQHGGFSWGALRTFCTAHFLSFQRMKEWLDLHAQLNQLISRKKQFTFNDEPASYESIHRALLSGLFRQCGRRKKGNLYLGLGSRELMIFPGSLQYNRGGDWIFGGSIIETSQLFILLAATIEPEWLEKSAGKYCSYAWSNVRYQKKSGRVMADETVTLHGLVLITGRQVDYPRRDPRNIAKAREIFIASGLVDNQLQGRFAFYDHNRALIGTWQQSEHKLRRKDIVIDERTLFDFYDRRLPDQVCDRPSLIRSIRKRGDRDLFMAEQDILLRMPDQKDLLDFPSHLPHTDRQVALHYSFEPGTEHDGVTATIPERLLEHIDQDLFDWLVPGLIVEKTTVLLKGLPKRLRKQIIPISNSVALILDSLEMYRGNYYEKLASAIFNRYKVTVRGGDWPTDLPTHLMLHFRIVDESGALLAQGNDLSALVDRFHESPQQGGEPAVRKKDRELIESLKHRIFTDWDFDGYPDRIGSYLPDNQIGGYLYATLSPCPAKKGVQLRYLSSREDARSAGIPGLCYLIRLRFRAAFKQLEKHCRITFSGPSTIWLSAFLGSTADCCESIMTFVTRSLIGGRIDRPLITKAHYDSLVEKMQRVDVYRSGMAIIEQILETLRQRHGVIESINRFEQLSRSGGAADNELYEDLKEQCDIILPADFLDRFSPQDLTACSRYFKSLAIRCERAYSNPAKDRDKRMRLIGLESRLDDLLCKNPRLSREGADRLEQYRQMLAELRISLFSPELKTIMPVSEKRLSRLWKEISNGC